MYTWWSSVVGLKTSDIIGKHWEGTFLCTMSTFAIDTISTFCRYYTLLLEKWVECRIFNCKRAEWPVSSNAADLTLFVVFLLCLQTSLLNYFPSTACDVDLTDRYVYYRQADMGGLWHDGENPSPPCIYPSLWRHRPMGVAHLSVAPGFTQAHSVLIKTPWDSKFLVLKVQIQRKQSHGRC